MKKRDCNVGRPESTGDDGGRLGVGMHERARTRRRRPQTSMLAPTKDASQADPGDSSTSDSSTNDSSTGDADVGGDSGVIDAYMKACARIDACAATGTAKIGMNGCYSLITAKPFERGLGPTGACATREPRVQARGDDVRGGASM